MRVRPQAPHEILNRQFKFLQQQNKSYSLRALARDLKISPSFLSELFKGKRSLPKARLKEMKRIMKMDDITQGLLDQALANEILKKLPNLKKEIERGRFRSSMAEYQNISKRHLPIFTDWYNVAIMDLTTCKDFNDHPKWIASRLGLKVEQVEKALSMLEDEGFLSRVDGVLSKTTKRIRIPTTRSLEVIRRVHAQLIDRALHHLLNDTEQNDFDARLINGVMFAANPQNLQRAKQKLNDALYEVVEILTEGECTEVYQLNCQLFPLTKLRP